MYFQLRPCTEATHIGSTAIYENLFCRIEINRVINMEIKYKI